MVSQIAKDICKKNYNQDACNSCCLKFCCLKELENEKFKDEKVGDKFAK